MATLYDACNPAPIPSGVLAAGYINGSCATDWTPQQWSRFLPNSPRITVHPTTHAPILDAEFGNCTPTQAVDWLQTFRTPTTQLTIYCGRNTYWPTIKSIVADRRIRPPAYWIADQTGTPHLVPGSTATQYTDFGHTTYDLSITNGLWPTHPIYPTTTITETPMAMQTSTLQVAPTGKIVLVSRVAINNQHYYRIFATKSNSPISQSSTWDIMTMSSAFPAYPVA